VAPQKGSDARLQLAAVFFLRTVITLPVLALAGHLLF
jgi:hypothetical protein